MREIPTQDRKRAVEFETYEEANETYYALAKIRNGSQGSGPDADAMIISRLMACISEMCGGMIREGKP